MNFCEMSKNAKFFVRKNKLLMPQNKTETTRCISSSAQVHKDTCFKIMPKYISNTENVLYCSRLQCYFMYCSLTCKQLFQPNTFYTICQREIGVHSPQSPILRIAPFHFNPKSVIFITLRSVNSHCPPPKIDQCVGISHGQTQQYSIRNTALL